MDQVEEKEQDKRIFTRLKMETPAQVVILDKAKRLNAVCRDLSGGGMLLECRIGLPKGTEVEVTLASHYGEAPMLRARAQVARLQKNTDGMFILGMEITEILD